MRILVVTPTYLPVLGGIESLIYEIFTRLQNQHEVRVLTPHLPSKLISQSGANDTYFDNELSVLRFHDLFSVAFPKLENVFGIFLPPISISYLVSVVKQVKDFKPNIINMYCIVPGGLALMAIKILTKIPVILSLPSRSDVLLDQNPQFRRHRHYFLSTLKYASLTIVPSQYTLGQHIGLIKHEVIPYGVDTKRFSPLVEGKNIRHALGISGDQIVLFSLQRLIKLKNIDFLFKVLRSLLDHHANATLVIGGKGPQEFYLKSLVKDMGLQTRVVFTGYIPEATLPEYFAMSDLFVFSSTSETFGIVFAQAMSSGKPIAAVNTTCLEQVIDNDSNGMLIDSFDPLAFSKRLIQLIKNKKTYENYAMNARKKAQQEYDWDHIAESHNKVFTRTAKKDLR